MDDAKALTQHQQQQMMIQQQQQHQQQQQQQQMLMLQQLQHQKQQAMSRFPSNIDAHLRTPGFPRQMVNPNLQQQPSPSPNPNNPNPGAESQHQNLQPSQTVAAQVQQQQQQQRMVRPPANQTELHLAYQDAWRVCHPDYKRPFASIEDACERLLPYHVVADYEAEEDDRILDSDTTGQMLSRSQQWDNNIAAKVAEFTGTFEKQVYAFNLISRKRGQGEFRAEERLMIEQALLQEEKRAMLELRAEIESREKAGREANMRMAAMAQASQVQSQSHARAEMMARGAIRANALGSHSNDVSMGHDMGDQEHEGNPDGMMNGWGHNGQRDDEAPDDFLNDEENENGDARAQDDEWRESGEFDLNTR